MSDPGLQPERTAMAWRRTQLSLLMAAALLCRTTHLARSPGQQLLVALLALGAIACAELRIRQLMRGGTGAMGHLGAVQLLAAGGLCLVGLATTYR